jgi:hypothetical protein
VRKTWPFMVAAVVPSALVGIVLALPSGGGNDLVLGPESTVAQVASEPAVPLAALTRVVVAGPADVAAQVAALGYPEVTQANSLISDPGVFYRDGFRDAAHQLAAAMGLSIDPAPLTAVVTGGDDMGDVIVVLP